MKIFIVMFDSAPKCCDGDRYGYDDPEPVMAFKTLEAAENYATNMNKRTHKKYGEDCYYVDRSIELRS